MAAGPKTIDEYLATVGADKRAAPCGWLKDKYGLSWQINPTILGKMPSDPDPGKSKRVMDAMLKMKKIDIARLKQAYDQR